VAEDVQRADRPLLVQQRHDQLRRHARDDRDVARVGRDVVDEQRHLARDRGADQAPPEFQGQRRDAVGIAHGVRGQQLAAPLVEQVDGERVELDEPRNQLRDSAGAARRGRGPP
jgi:hypothetical protein